MVMGCVPNYPRIAVSADNAYGAYENRHRENKKMKKTSFIVIIASFIAFLSGCASPTYTFREKMAKLNMECMEMKTNNPKLSELELDKACWTAALNEFPEYEEKIKSMIFLIGKIQEKQARGEDIAEDMKNYKALTVAMIQYASSRAESAENGSGNAWQRLFQIGLIMAIGAPK